MDTLYNLETYNYSLREELVAQYPLEKRDSSRLLCYEKSGKKITHHKFYEIVDLLSKDDVLVLNNTKVLPARFYVRNQKEKEVEILLVSAASPDNLTWKVLAKPKKYLKGQSAISTQHSEIEVNVIDPETIRFHNHNDLEFVLKKAGQMPLPPYIKRKSENIDVERYQTVFASKEGAVAAPTAGLHFTEELLEKIKKIGVEILYLTLHVGPGTFLPVRTNDVREHKLIPEFFYIEKEVWEKILKAKENKKRIIACGTTTTRALEYAYLVKKLSGLNNLFITPDFKFNIVDGLITNFHLPETTLLLLVSAFIGWDNVKKIYEEAINEKYRFYSYGDGMFIV